jgi:hypothetical protein
MKKFKITKEQYNRLFASGLINETFDKVDGAFKKAFKGKDIKNIKVDEDTKFKIERPIPNLPQNMQKFGKPIMEGGYDLKKETLELLRYFYRKTDKFSPFWGEYNLTYDDIVDELIGKNIVTKKDGKIELVKDGKSKEEAIEALALELRNMIDQNGSINEYDDEPWNQPMEPNIQRKKGEYTVVAYNPEIAIVKDAAGNMYAFDYWDMKDEIMTDEVKGVTEDDIEEYLFWESPTKGEGLVDWENGAKLVKIDQQLKNDLLTFYGDTEVGRVLSSISEGDAKSNIDKFKSDTAKAFTPTSRPEKTPEEKAMILAKLKDIRAKEMERRASEEEPEELDEMTSAASSGQYTGLFSAQPIKKEMPITGKVPVVKETMEASTDTVGAYTAPAFKMKANHSDFAKVKPNAFKKTQWAGGGFVEMDDCTKLNNNKDAQNGGCSAGAVDNVVKIKKTKGNVNAPSLSENVKPVLYKKVTSNKK